jgi:putative peptidoglycan lipid II flippase
VVVLLAVPCAAALLTLPSRWWPRCITTAFYRRDVTQTTSALMGYGAGLLGLVSKCCARFLRQPEHQDACRIAIAVLVITQLLNLVLVPFFNMPVWHWPLAWGADQCAVAAGRLIRAEATRPRPVGANFAGHRCHSHSGGSFLLWAQNAELVDT